jgi:hypothetical protein
VNAATMTERQALDAAIKRAVSSAPFVRSISAALATVLTPDDGTCVLPPMCQQTRQVKFHDPRYGMGYDVEDGAGWKIGAHQSTHPNSYLQWLITETRIDGEGQSWTRFGGRMVIDDFGDLVGVAS